MKKLKVLVIDDYESIRTIVKDLIKGMFRDLELFEASSGEEGISVISREKGEINLIVTDYRMFDGNGFEVARFTQESYPDIKVVLMTSEPLANEFQKTAAILGIKIIIPKPFVLEEFRDKIKEVIGNI